LQVSAYSTLYHSGFGVLGFLAMWFITEVIQVLAILRLKRRLVGDAANLDFSPVYKLFALMGLATASGAWFATTSDRQLQRDLVAEHVPEEDMAFLDAGCVAGSTLKQA
jgi:hypothetical protein